MNVSKTIETPTGTVVFEGELETEELDLVLKVGLSYLFQAGAFNNLIKKGSHEEPSQKQ